MLAVPIMMLVVTVGMFVMAVMCSWDSYKERDWFAGTMYGIMIGPVSVLIYLWIDAILSH